MHKMERLRNEKGFTLIEIIAVLVVLGILALVAVPKYMSLADEARNKAAVGAIAEVKGRCNLAYSKLLLERNGGKVSADDVVKKIGTAPDVGEDFKVAVKKKDDKTITISVVAVGGSELKDPVTGEFVLPTT